MNQIEKARSEGRLLLNTKEAAAALGRTPQTLRRWSISSDSPIRPIKVGGHLGWRVDDLASLIHLGSTAGGDEHD